MSIPWEQPQHVSAVGDETLLRVDFEQRPDLAEHFDIARAPALVLLDTDGQIVWR